MIRQTDYFSQMPVLPIECPDLDGIHDSIPVIFEDLYSHSQQIDLKIQTGNLKQSALIKPNKHEQLHNKTTANAINSSHIVNSKSFPSAKTLREHQKKQIEMKKTKEVLKKARKNHDIIASENNPIQLIGYRKMNDDGLEALSNQFSDLTKTSEFAKTFRNTFTASLPINYTTKTNGQFDSAKSQSKEVKTSK